MKEKISIARVIANNLILPALEIAWFALAYFGAFKFLMRGTSGQAFDIDFTFIVISQIVFVFTHIVLVNIKTEKITQIKYNLLSSFGVLATFIFFMKELKFGILGISISTIVMILIYATALLIFNRLAGVRK